MSETYRGRSLTRTLALVLAYALVMQGLLAGLASGLSAAPSPPFGLGVLCSPSSPARSVDLPAAPPAPADADCCVLGCAMFGPLVALVPAPALLGRTQGTPAPLVRLPPDFITLALDRHTPRSTRGPPHAA